MNTQQKESEKTMDEQQANNFLALVKRYEQQNNVQISFINSVQGCVVYIIYDNEQYFDIRENVYNALEKDIVKYGYNTNCDFAILMTSEQKHIDKKRKK